MIATGNANQELTIDSRGVPYRGLFLNCAYRLDSAKRDLAKECTGSVGATCGRPLRDGVDILNTLGEYAGLYGFAADLGGMP